MVRPNPYNIGQCLIFNSILVFPQKGMVYSSSTLATLVYFWATTRRKLKVLGTLKTITKPCNLVLHSPTGKVWRHAAFVTNVETKAKCFINHKQFQVTVLKVAAAPGIQLSPSVRGTVFWEKADFSGRQKNDFCTNSAS